VTQVSTVTLLLLQISLDLIVLLVTIAPLELNSLDHAQLVLTKPKLALLRKMPVRVAHSANSVQKVPVCHWTVRMVSTVLSERLLKSLAEAVTTAMRTPDGKKNNAQSISTAHVDHLSLFLARNNTLVLEVPKLKNFVKTVNMLTQDHLDLEE
jgi:hypothetical protein